MPSKSSPPPPEPNYNEELVPAYQLPDLLDSNGKFSETRRRALLELFTTEVYGRVPETEWRLEVEPIGGDMPFLEGRGWLRQLGVGIRTGRGLRRFTLLVISPHLDQPAPHFLGINFHGNQTVHDDPGILLPEPGLDSDSGGKVYTDLRPRGFAASRWPFGTILEAGFGVATFFCGEVDPDYHDQFRNGLHQIMDRDERGPESWGTIATWAWALSRSLDVLQNVPGVDPDRVAVFGHSRMGKTALWAGANDPRFAAVISNESGCGGAALFRREFGERPHLINWRFPHWFCRNFHAYNGRDSELPIDQHQLLALIAPRPLYVASAAGDRFADPRGEFLATHAASPAWEAAGLAGLGASELPPVDTPVQSGKVAYHIRSGAHDITAYDWELFLSFTRKNLPRER